MERRRFFQSFLALPFASRFAKQAMVGDLMPLQFSPGRHVLMQSSPMAIRSLVLDAQQDSRIFKDGMVNLTNPPVAAVIKRGGGVYAYDGEGDDQPPPAPEFSNEVHLVCQGQCLASLPLRMPILP